MMETTTSVEQANSLDNHIGISLAVKDYMKQPEDRRGEWVDSQLKANLPDGKIKAAYFSGSEEYAFRCIKRRSDSLLLDSSKPDSTLEKTLDSIKNNGIDSTSIVAPTNILRGKPWQRYLIPTPSELAEGQDISIALIYKSGEVAIPLQDDASKSVRLDLGTTTGIPISNEEAAKLPSLKDRFVGYIEIRWDKGNNGELRIIDRVRNLLK